MSMTPAERTERARIAAHSLHAQRDPRETTAKARATFRDGFLEKVDPDGILDLNERQRRADSAYRAHMARIRLGSLRKRRLERTRVTAKGK